MSANGDMQIEIDAANPLMTRIEGQSPVMEVVADIIKRAVLITPLAIGLGWLIWESPGAWSVALGIGLILFNLFLSAWLMQVTARISFAALAGGVMFGFLIRLGIIMIVVLLLRNQSWVDLVALGLTIVVTHLGLLFWELRYVSASLAFPGLKPGAGVLQPSHSTKETSSS